MSIVAMTRLPLAIRAAILWNRIGLKGRGTVPRVIGRRWRGGDLYIATRHGGKLLVDPPNLDMYASIVNGGGTWEPHVMQTCARVLRPGDVYYDIGSNTGLFSIDAAMHIKDLTIYAFEPQPTLAECIRRSVAANGLGNIVCLEMLLGSENGVGSLYLTSHSIHASMAPREKQFRELEREMWTIDTLIGDGRIKGPDVIKIDVEGAELLVLNGAAKALRDHAPSIVFEADQNMDRMNVTARSLFDTLRAAADYTFYVIEADGRLAAVSDNPGHGNFLALSPRHHGRVERPA